VCMFVYLKCTQSFVVHLPRFYFKDQLMWLVLTMRVFGHEWGNVCVCVSVCCKVCHFHTPGAHTPAAAIVILLKRYVYVMWAPLDKQALFFKYPYVVDSRQVGRLVGRQLDPSVNYVSIYLAVHLYYSLFLILSFLLSGICIALFSAFSFCMHKQQTNQLICQHFLVAAHSQLSLYL